MTTTEIIVTESRELHQLTAQMQRHVDRTLVADRKGGEALWEKSLAVADARADAQAREWGAYLHATGQHERSARRLVAIADRGRKEERFRTAIISGWLTFSVGAIAAQADDELLTNLLEQPTPPTRAQLTARPDTGVRSQLTAQPDNVVGSLVVEAPTKPLTSVIDALRKDDTKAAYAASRAIINNIEDRKRAFEAVDARVDGKSIATVLAMLEQPTTPALSAFPPGHVEAGIGAIARRLQSGSQISTDAPWAEKLRIQLDAARETMQPAVYETWSARIGAVQAALVKAAVNAAIEAPQAAPVKKTTSHAMLLEYAESMLSGVVEGIPDTAIHLVAALVCWEYEPYSGDDPREALFQTLKILAKDNLDVVETAIEKGRS